MDELTPSQTPQNINPAGTPQQNSYPPTPPPISPPPQHNIVPPPPATPDIAVHTMATDMASIEKSGGDKPEPQFVTFPVATPIELPPPPPTGNSKAFLWLIALILIIGTAWATYAYFWPLFFAQSQPQPELAVMPAPIPAVTTPAPLIAQPETNFFGTDGMNMTRVTVDATPASIITALANEAKIKPVAGDIKQFSLQTATGPVTFGQFIGILLPEIQNQETTATFTNSLNPDFTAYLFYDTQGVWPGYIAKINPAMNADSIELSDRLQKIESMSYINFFLSPPGAIQSFRTGAIAEKYIYRFAPFSQPGASFNYGVFEDYVIINTSYDGLLKALELLKI